MKRTYILENLDCANCASKIEKNVNKLEGVKEATVTFVSKKLSVESEHDELENITKLVKKLEPDVDVVVEGSVQSHEGYNHSHEGHNHAEHGHEGHDHSHESCSIEDAPIVHDVNGKHVQTFYVKGLDCASCATKVENEIKKSDLVQDASLAFATGKLDIAFSSASYEGEWETIKKQVKKIEPEVTFDDVKQKKEKKIKLFDIKKSWDLVLGTIIYIIAIIFGKGNLELPLFLIAYLLIGYKVLVKSARNIMAGEVFDENFLMSVATIGAFFIQEYPDAVAVMLFYQIGELVQSFTVEKSRKSIGDLMDIQVEQATKIIDGKEVVVPVDAVQVGDTIVIKAGERIAVDGVVLTGRTMLDTSALTGESVPRRIEEGEEALSGSLVLDGVIQLRVEKLASESTVARILDMVENASSKKAHVEAFITKFSKVYTPLVVLLAVLLVAIPTIFVPGADFSDWLYRGLTFLVVSCPCALVISVPLGLFAGIGGASKAGILVKGGNYLEALDEVDTIVFDKTGTLTKGNFSVSVKKSVEGNDEALLEKMAYAEYHSNHPIALSIKKAYGKEIDTSNIQDYEEIAGHGISVKVNHKTYYAGNEKLMNKYGVTFDAYHGIGSVVYLSEDNNYLGYIVVADELKANTKQAIHELQTAGVKTVMLTGDRKENGELVAKEVGIDEVYTQLLPQDKVEKVEMLLSKQANKHKLAFVGDGINDAPVLARVDVGVAMGGIGSDAAIEAADIVLMNDDPMSLVTAKKIARKTMSILRQNVVFSIGVKVAVLILSAFGYANMWLGVFADVGVTILAILNSMRALYHKES